MNDLVKASIDSRKDAIFNAYDIKNQDTINKIEEYFKKVYDFGTNCSDNMDFETKFASSPLNQEYIDLFTLVATSETPKTISSEPTDVKSNGDVIAENAVSDLNYMVDDLWELHSCELGEDKYGNEQTIFTYIGHADFKKNKNVIEVQEEYKDLVEKVLAKYK